jgi:RNA polymerase sigma factor (sigma-70 family)
VVARRPALRLIGERRPARTRPLPHDGSDGGAHASELADPAPGPAERVEREEAQAVVREAVATLSHRDALAIRLFYENELSHKQIGMVIGVPVTHVGQILARAREKLRARLDGAGLGGVS